VCVSWIFCFSVCLGFYDLRRLPFGSPANRFLSGKAENAVKTRQVFSLSSGDTRRFEDDGSYI